MGNESSGHEPLLEEVLKKLPHHNLEGQLNTLTLERAIGGFSDIYSGTFKDEIFRDPLTSTVCVVCRQLKGSQAHGEVPCDSCDNIWNRKLAIKTIRVHVEGRDHSKDIARELYVFSKLSHPNILPFTGFLFQGNFPAIVTPWAAGGSLLSQIRDGTMLDCSEDTILRLACGIANGLAYLHGRDILHCDLKSDNILLSSTGIPLLADFGRSRFIGENMSVIISRSLAGPATLRWSAPELFTESACFSTQTDVWAFGMVLYELVTHKFPYFEQSLETQVMSMITSGHLPKWPTEEDMVQTTIPSAVALRDLCKDCWAAQSKDRPLAQTISMRLYKNDTKFWRERTLILNELLLSERAYASDLASLRDVHIPLALGQRASTHDSINDTPPSSSESFTRKDPAVSDSASSLNLDAPMTAEDVRLIYSNVKELALFSGGLSERIKEALGDVLEGGEGEDRVGELFLEIIPQMEPYYRVYITRHQTALQHLQSLPKTRALNAYFAKVQSVSSSPTSPTHARDIPSLLIKPVRRLMNYLRILAMIIERTPDGHGDKDKLKAALKGMEEVASRINEEVKRVEIVNGVLTGKLNWQTNSGLKYLKGASGASAPAMQIGVDIRNNSLNEDNEAVLRAEAYEKKLKECDTFVREFAKDIVGWAASVKKSIEHLREWALCFARTIGISEETPSEAFSAFLDVLDMRMTPLCDELVDFVGKELLPRLVRLVHTCKSPMKLLDAMHSLETLRYSKNRTAAAVMDASQNYLALCSQLNSELPAYLKLLDAGIVRCIRLFACRQTDFWFTVKDQWATLWECLRMKGETNAGYVETLRLWWNRYSEIDERVAKLSLLKRDRVTSMSQLVPLPSSPAPSSSSSRPGSTRHRSFGSMDAVTSPDMHDRLPRSPSTESFPTGLRTKSRTRTPGSIGRRSARSDTTPLPASTSSPTLNMYASTSSHSHSYSHGHQQHHYHSREVSEWGETRSTNDAQGPKSRSFVRRLGESLRAPLRRAPSPSHKSIGSVASGKATYAEPATNAAAAPPVPITLEEWPAKYLVIVVHPFETREVMYREHPFFPLQLDEIYDVLDDAGHPSTCEGLPLHIDDEDDMNDRLLLVRNMYGEIGWALASYLVPIA